MASSTTHDATGAIPADPADLRADVQAHYRQDARHPDAGLHSRTGHDLAMRCRYDVAAVDVPRPVGVESFAGVANPFELRPIPRTARVVDVDSGAGFDSVTVARAVSPLGRVIGVDMTPEMLAKAQTNAQVLHLDNVESRAGLAESLLVEDGWADVMISNGAFNLCADKQAVVRRGDPRAASGWSAAVRRPRQRAAGSRRGAAPPSTCGSGELPVACRVQAGGRCPPTPASSTSRSATPSTPSPEPAVKPTPPPSTSTGIPSVPSSADRQSCRPERPILVGNTGDGIGFLDAPGVDAGALFDTVDDVLADMPAEAILTVFTDDPAGPEVAAEWCAGRGVELLAIIRHEHEGTTLTFRTPAP